MTVTTRTASNDVAGKTLDASYTTLQAHTAVAPAGPQLFGAQFHQANAERDLVFHHLRTGRLSAAAILAASVYLPGGTSPLVIPSNDPTTQALLTNITALQAKVGAGPQQSFNLQALDQAQRELVAVCIGKGYTQPSFILGSAAL